LNDFYYGIDYENGGDNVVADYRDLDFSVAVASVASVVDTDTVAVVGIENRIGPDNGKAVAYVDFGIDIDIDIGFDIEIDDIVDNSLAEDRFVEDIAVVVDFDIVVKFVDGYNILTFYLKQTLVSSVLT